MNITITKEIKRELDNRGISIVGYTFLLSIHENEDIFDDNCVKTYLIAQDLTIRGYIQEDHSENPELYHLTEKGLNFIQKLQENG